MTTERNRTCHPSRRLFDREEMVLRPTGRARLRALAQRPARPATVRERKLEEDQATIEKLRAWGVQLTRLFGLSVQAIDAEKDGVVEHYGVCYEDGVIRIRLRHAKTGRLLKESSLVDTLCHELAHLRYLDHSIRFQRLYKRILDKARQLEIYRPGRPEKHGPTQLGLFETGPCGTRARTAQRST